MGLGTSGVVFYTLDNQEHGGWYYHKTLWGVSPQYRGAISIIGRQVGGKQELRFNPGAGFPGANATSLLMPSGDSGTWRYLPSDTLIRAPGCYAFHITGEGVSQTVTFMAEP